MAQDPTRLPLAAPELHFSLHDLFFVIDIVYFAFYSTHMMLSNQETKINTEDIMWYIRGHTD